MLKQQGGFMPSLTLVLIMMLFMFTQLFGAIGFGYSVPTLNDTVDPSVTLLTPLPGEIWYMGQTKDINWLATDTNLSEYGIWVYYSLDNGNSFIPLAGPLANTGTCSFTIPEEESDVARVKVIAIDNFGNVTPATNRLSFSYCPPQSVQNVEVNVTGNLIVITWQAVTQNLLLDPISPDGYLLFESDLPSQNPEDYLLLANTVDTSYTFQHDPQVSRKFYYVVAYKGSLDRLLPQSVISHEPSPTLREIIHLIKEKSLEGGR
jgi:hypothetical protein